MHCRITLNLPQKSGYSRDTVYISLTFRVGIIQFHTVELKVSNYALQNYIIPTPTVRLQQRHWIYQPDVCGRLKVSNYALQNYIKPTPKVRLIYIVSLLQPDFWGRVNPVPHCRTQSIQLCIVDLDYPYPKSQANIYSVSPLA